MKNEKKVFCMSKFTILDILVRSTPSFAFFRHKLVCAESELVIQKLEKFVFGDLLECYPTPHRNGKIK